MTLSRFLRDYIYIPLGGNKKGTLRTYNNLMATFILGGLWHGAGWTFIFWGFLHGFALMIHRVWQNIGFKFPTIIAWFITFNFINITWVFFRAKEWDDAIKVLDSMFFGQVLISHNWINKFDFMKDAGFMPGFWSQNLGNGEKAIYFILVSLFISVVFKNSIELKDTFRLNRKSFIFTSIIFIVALSNLNKISEFLYFNF